MAFSSFYGLNNIKKENRHECFLELFALVNKDLHFFYSSTSKELIKNSALFISTLQIIEEGKRYKCFSKLLELDKKALISFLLIQIFINQLNISQRY